ncbi:MAG: hypothetical protein ACHQNT_11405 [Bacteroidia bacterium]
MTHKNQTDALNETISLLQDKQAHQLKILREQFNITYESLKPINLIKSTFREVASSPEIKNNMVSNAIGLTTGYLSKKVLFGASHNPVKRLIGTFLQFAIANVVSKHSDTIKSTGESFVKRIFKNKNEAKQQFSNNGN